VRSNHLTLALAILLGNQPCRFKRFHWVDLDRARADGPDRKRDIGMSW